MSPDEAAALATIGRCTGQGCGERLRWARTRKGKAQPLDAEPNPSGNVAFTGELELGEPVIEVLGPLDVGDTRTRYMPHHATCPDADRFKRSRPGR